MDIEQARFNMVEQQVRTWAVLDPQVLDLLFTVRREEFVPPAHRLLAFADLELPLGDGERMWTPKMEARVVQDLTLEPGDEVLEIGTGSGYLTALLASLGAKVTSVEINPRLAATARQNLDRAGLREVTLAIGDGARGWGRGEYDAIVLTGSTPQLDDAFLRQLKPGGRVFAVIGDAPVMTARVIRWVGAGSFTTTDRFETVIAPLQNAAAPARFAL
ncbi:MAG: protein-L-isoaspartate O-methyltransferase [Betaproteobacteria bacterium]|nr:protein-L-isoaspartate O-methyltransferase [Betaproteobacteria bacterium]